jgi:hypothetical protein
MDVAPSCAWTLRKDGLGNRLEEMADVGTNRTFYWPLIARGHESYAGFARYLRFDGSVLREGEAPPSRLCEQHDHRRGATAQLIRPAFNLSFGRWFGGCAPVGVHIRAGDRLCTPSFKGCRRCPHNPGCPLANHTHDAHGATDFESLAELKRAHRLAVSGLNLMRPRAVFIADDGSAIARELSSALRASLPPSTRVVAPLVSGGKQPFTDFFALARCREVWMVSRFSSFAIMAAEVGGAPLRSMLPPDATALHRFGVAARPFPIGTPWGHGDRGSSRDGPACSEK